ncbi:Protein C47E8.1 [Aphelenchoides avenae]|nr:Protein C47E8.1 [Aphelenchus avenae]
MFSVLLSAFGTSGLAAILPALFAAIVYEWYNLHGVKLTRAERVTFDEKNLLSTTKLFEFNLGPVLDDITPGGTSTGCCGKYPGPGILSSLFRDEQAEEMQKFYREHYGPVYPTAKRAEIEMDAAKMLEKKDASRKK